MKEVQYVTLTQMIVDAIYFPWGAGKSGQLGGGVYAVAGQRIWDDQVGFCCLIGPDYKGYSAWFLDNDIDVAGVLCEKNCVHAQIRYFEDGEREEILLPNCGSHDEMLPRFSHLPPRYAGSKGLYFFKDLDEDYWEEAASYLAGYGGVSCWEIHGSAARAENRDRIADCLSLVDLFSLNLTEGRRITGEAEPLRVLKKLQDMHAGKVILRMGAQGALAAGDGAVWRIPVVPTDVVDVTGGGNSSTGGFLVGYCKSGGDIAYAAKCGAVSASFIISQWGVPKKLDSALRAKAENRLRNLDAVKL